MPNIPFVQIYIINKYKSKFSKWILTYSMKGAVAGIIQESSVAAFPLRSLQKIMVG